MDRNCCEELEAIAGDPRVKVRSGCRIKRALIVQQVPHEGPGLIGDELKKHGVGMDVVRAWGRDRFPASAEGYDALIVLGGPMGVYEEERFPFIRDEIRLVEGALKAGVPTLGVCLGSQIMARAAGARVYKGKTKEIGYYKVRLTDSGRKDPLFMGFPDEFTVFQWHGDTFDVPGGARNLASSDAFPNQLIKVGRSAYGVQFHLEVTGGMVRDWIAVNSDELASLKGRIDPEKIVEATPGEMPALHRHGRTFLRRFMRLI